MANENTNSTRTKVIIATFLLVGIVVVSWMGYSRYHDNRWLTIKENRDEWFEVNGELAKEEAAPCPEMILRQGKVKFIEILSDKGQRQLGYKITVGSELGKQEKDPLKYAPFLYQLRFRFTLVDKDGFPLQVVEGPAEYEIFYISKDRNYQNVCPKGIPVTITKKSQWVEVSYILTATSSLKK